MEKLDIHEFLRIYLPGLFLAFVGGRMLFGPDVENPVVATSAIFLGLAFSWFGTRLAQKTFQWVATCAHFGRAGKADYWTAWVEATGDVPPTRSGDEAPVSPDADSEDALRMHVNSASFAHYARRYGSAELYGFRLPKTFGVLYFNIAVAATLLALLPLLSGMVPLLAYHVLTLSPMSDVALLLVVAALFAWISRDYFIVSMRMELMYWKGRSLAGEATGEPGAGAGRSGGAGT